MNSGSIRLVGMKERQRFLFPLEIDVPCFCQERTSFEIPTHSHNLFSAVSFTLCPTMEEDVDRMKEGQNDTYYITGQSIAVVSSYSS